MLKNTTLVALSLVTVEIQFNFCDKTNNGKLWCCPLYPRYDNALWILCCSVESLISFITTAVLQLENVSIVCFRSVLWLSDDISSPITSGSRSRYACTSY